MARKQAMVIGMGQFGMALGRALAERQVDVLAVDLLEARIQAASAFAKDALTLDAMDENALASLRPRTRDLCVCAIGDAHREASIFVTAVLRQLGAPRIVSRASDTVHERILSLVGAHEVINPDRIVGQRLAARLAVDGVVDAMDLGDDLVITEVDAPSSLVGRSLAELELPRRYGLTVLAIRSASDQQASVVQPRPDLRLSERDVLVVVGPAGAASRFSQEAR